MQKAKTLRRLFTLLLQERSEADMKLSVLNVKTEWDFYNKVAPFQMYLLNGNELKYRY